MFAVEAMWVIVDLYCFPDYAWTVAMDVHGDVGFVKVDSVFGC
jgi:hypothetical protein